MLAEYKVAGAVAAMVGTTNISILLLKLERKVFPYQLAAYGKAFWVEKKV